MGRTASFSPGVLVVLGILGILIIGGAANLAAHHGWTGYTDKETRLSGTITMFTYENPHASVDLNVDGKSYHIVLAPPSRMQSRGLQKEMLKVGGKATIAGYVHRTNPNELRAERITIGDKTTELR